MILKLLMSVLIFSTLAVAGELPTTLGLHSIDIHDSQIKAALDSGGFSPFNFFDEFYKAGGKGTVYYSPVDCDEFLRGAFLVAEAFPQKVVPDSHSLYLRDGEVLKQLNASLSNPEVTVFLGVRFRGNTFYTYTDGAAYTLGSGGELVTKLNTLANKDVTNGIVIVTSALDLDLLVHEMTHSTDYRQTHYSLVDDINALLPTMKEELQIKFFDAVMELRAYGKQVNYLLDPDHFRDEEWIILPKGNMRPLASNYVMSPEYFKIVAMPGEDFRNLKTRQPQSTMDYESVYLYINEYKKDVEGLFKEFKDDEANLKGMKQILKKYVAKDGRVGLDEIFPQIVL